MQQLVWQNPHKQKQNCKIQGKKKKVDLIHICFWQVQNPSWPTCTLHRAAAME